LQIQQLVKLDEEMKRYSLDSIPQEVIHRAKQMGYSDLQLAYLLSTTEEKV